MPRLFTGVEIPDDVAFDLDLMKGGITGSRWIDRDTFHITLRFIGDIDDSLAREIAYELDGVTARPFSLRLKGIDVFGGNKPHTLFAGVEESADLRRLQQIHERICQVLGLPPEQRKFTPHVTLARLKDPTLAPCSISWRPTAYTKAGCSKLAASCCFPRARRGAAGPMRSRNPTNCRHLREGRTSDRGERTKALRELPGWSEATGRDAITRTFQFKSFNRGLGLDEPGGALRGENRPPPRVV